MLAEQTSRLPPPLAEPLHWLIRTTRPADSVPLALQIRPTSVPPFAEPLHCVIVAPVVVAGNGSHTIVAPMAPDSPDPTHWLTVTAVSFGSISTKLLVTSTLHRRTPPPPLIESLHWVIAVTGSVRSSVTVVQAVSGTPAEPVHSRTVTVAEPPVAVIVLTT